MSEKDAPIVDEEEEFCRWFEQEILWWSKLHGKELDEEVVENILDELLSSGYTLRQANDFCVHERLRRHRWDLSITVFYPDDKLVVSELVTAMQRAYKRGYIEATRQKNEQRNEHNRNETEKKVDLFNEIARLYSTVNVLEEELAKHRRKK